MVRIVYIDCSTLMREALAGIPGVPPMTVFEGDPTVDELRRLIADAEIVLNGHTAMPESIFADAKRLRSIVFLGTGASSYIDMAATARSGIAVRTIKGYGDRTVAEHAFALLMTAARDIARMDREVRAGTWVPREGLELEGRSLGLVGLGGIGSEMARIATGFGMRVLAWNRSGVAAGPHVESVALDVLLARADAISMHLALVPETRGIIDARRIALMKRGVLLVNTARGALIDEPALIAALESGHVGHAALDVFATEPLPAGHQLTRLGNVTLASHAGWKSRAAGERLLRKSLEVALADAARLDAGQPLSA